MMLFARFRRRQGSVLLIVLVLIPILALAGYSFTHAMRAESAGSISGLRQSQARMAAESGVHYVMAMLAGGEALSAESGSNLHNDSTAFAKQAVTLGDGPLTAYFSVVAPDEVSPGSIRYGLTSECAKIPLGTGKIQLTREMLMKIPNMTQEAADSILDWVDADEEVREGGAETNYYSLQSPPYSPRNGPPRTIDELLLVKGVTPALWYGNDADMDGVLSTSENDGDASWPADTQTGAYNAGWRQYFTIHSIAVDAKADGTAKTDINGDVKAAAKALTDSFDLSIASYYAVHKKAGGLTALSSLIDSEIQIDPNQLEPAFTEAGLDPQSAAKSIGVTLPQSGGGRPPGQGLPGQGGSAEPVKVQSPWKLAAITDKLDKLYEEFRFGSEATLKGVIDVQHASAVVLQCLPGVTESDADKIANSGAEKTTPQASIAWVLKEKLLTVEQFRAVELLVTSSPRTFRCQTIGFFSPTGPSARMESILDCSGSAPKLVERRELTSLGNGYSREMLENAGTAP